ncbi:hypothetical protein [Pseudoalteromonas translucida]|uniref:Orphan protein n=1 Tax=Pseudoalteromonas translucida (strain TAC 125) TaxID=326442 RepID=Q3IGL3_PSET1|nr:hypothetical protein [Pseudoalteromonas translucida]CAI86620.1 putative orphan protein [Pseudoalteromonas translucida]|tara:strand:+ start:1542 stop:2441 length:900 start_codon:yes stop_codon:yes gene_type:complete
MSTWRFKDKLILADAAGTTLTGLHAIYASDVEFTPESESEKDELETSYSGASMETFYGEHVSLNFKTPLAMSGTAGTAPAYAPLLLACGMVQVADVSSVTFTKGAAVAAKCTLRFGKNTHNITQMKGNVSFALEKGKPMLNWQFKGLFSPPVASSAPPSVDWDRWVRPEVLGVSNSSDFKLSDTQRTLHKLTVDLGNNVVFDRAINHEEIMITGHESSANFTLSADELTNFDPWKDVGKVQTFEFTHGTAVGKKVTIIGRYQMPWPKYTSLDSELTGYEFDGKLVPSGTGYDELTIVFE